MRRTAKTTGLIVASAALGLATLSQCSAGLFDGLFDKQSGRDAIEKRLPACDCSFGYFSTSWQPWGTCDEGREAGCASGECRTAPSSVLPRFQPGYSSGQPSGDLQPYEEVWPNPGSVIPPGHSGTFQAAPNSRGSSPAPILMAPEHSSPGADYNAIPTDPFESESANPFPRAIQSNPDLLVPGAGAGAGPNPYSFSQPAPNSDGGLRVSPQPPPGSAIDLPFSPSRSPLDLPTLPATTPQPAVPGPTSDTGSSGTGINLPPRRSTSVTIDIPAGSAGSTLSLPDPVRSGTSDETTTSPGLSSPGQRAIGRPSPGQPAPGLPSRPGTILPEFDGALPAVTPDSPVTAPEPEPSLRRQPPLPVPSALPPSAALYPYPIQRPVTQYSAVQQPGVQPAGSRYPVTPRYPATQQYSASSQNPAATAYPAVQPRPQQQFQPATHWQQVPRRQQQPNANWRVMPGYYPQSGIQAQPQAQIQPQARVQMQPQARVQMQPAVQPQRQVQRPGPTPSDRVIMLPPPPRR